jgi:DNA polymerase III subunit epsilon
MEVEADVETTTLEAEHGRLVEGIRVACSRCGHTVEVFGTGLASVKRGCAMLRDECPFGERNFYVGVAPEEEKEERIHIKRKPAVPTAPTAPKPEPKPAVPKPQLKLVPMPTAPPETTLFFDTETTGLPRNYKAPVEDLDNWPRMVQLAWWIGDGARMDAHSAIVKPEGYTIPDEVAQIHGVTQARALKEGYPLFDVLSAFSVSLGEADVIVAHNLDFDRMIAGAEFIRVGEPEWAQHIVKRRGLCTMKSSVDLCRIPRGNGIGYKYPKLMELHNFLFQQGFEGAHDALNDVRAGVRCYWELKKRGVL